MPLKITAVDPAVKIREYRHNYVNIRRLIMETPDAPANIALSTPAERPIMSLDLPAGLRQAISDFQKNNPDRKSLKAVKYMNVTNGVPETVIEDENPLPSEDDLVTFSYTVTAVSKNSASIVSHQLVATLAQS